MSQIARVTTGDVAPAQARDSGPPTREAGAHGFGKGKFQSVFEGLGDEISQTGSAAVTDGGAGNDEAPNRQIGRGRFVSILQRLGTESSQADSNDGVEEAGAGPHGRPRNAKASVAVAADDPSRLADNSKPVSADAVGETRARAGRKGRSHDLAAKDPTETAEPGADAAPRAALNPVAAGAALVVPIANQSAVNADTQAVEVEKGVGPLRSNLRSSPPEDEPVEIEGPPVPATVLGKETHFSTPRANGSEAVAKPHALAVGDGVAEEGDEPRAADVPEAGHRALVKAQAAAEASSVGQAKPEEAVVLTPAAARGEGGSAAVTVPSLPHTAVQRIADAVLEAMPAPRPAGPTPAAATGVDIPVRVLHIRLDPPEYGSVTVRMALHGTALSLQLRADRETTAEALRHDKEKLADVLRADGYDTDVAMIDARRDTAPVRTDAPAMNTGGGGGGAGALADQPRGDGRSASRDPQGSRPDTRSHGPEGKPDGSPVPGTRAGALYV